MNDLFIQEEDNGQFSVIDRKTMRWIVTFLYRKDAEDYIAYAEPALSPYEQMPDDIAPHAPQIKPSLDARPRKFATSGIDIYKQAYPYSTEGEETEYIETEENETGEIETTNFENGVTIEQAKSINRKEIKFDDATASLDTLDDFLLEHPKNHNIDWELEKSLNPETEEQTSVFTIKDAGEHEYFEDIAANVGQSVLDEFYYAKKFSRLTREELDRERRLRAYFSFKSNDLYDLSKPSKPAVYDENPSTITIIDDDVYTPKFEQKTDDANINSDGVIDLGPVEEEERIFTIPRRQADDVGDYANYEAENGDKATIKRLKKEAKKNKSRQKRASQ